MCNVFNVNLPWEKIQLFLKMLAAWLLGLPSGPTLRWNNYVDQKSQKSFSAFLFFLFFFNRL